MKKNSFHILIGILICVAAIVLGLLTSTSHQVIRLANDGNTKSAKTIYSNYVATKPIQKLQFNTLLEKELRKLDDQYVTGKCSYNTVVASLKNFEELGSPEINDITYQYLSSMQVYRELREHINNAEYMEAATTFLQMQASLPDYSRAVKLMKSHEKDYVAALSSLIKQDGSYSTAEISSLVHSLEVANQVVSSKSSDSLFESFSNSLLAYLDKVDVSSVSSWKTAISTLQDTSQLMSNKSAQKANDSFAKKYCEYISAMTPEDDATWLEVMELSILTQSTFAGNKSVSAANASLQEQYVQYLQNRVSDMIPSYQHLEAEAMLKDALSVCDDSRISTLLDELEATEPATAKDVISLSGSKFSSGGNGIEANNQIIYSGDRVFYIDQEYGAYKLIIPLNGNYTHMTGTVLVGATGGADNAFGTLIYPDESCTDGTQLFSSGALSSDSEPIHFDVDLRERDQICIFFANNEVWFRSASVIYADICFYDY